MTDESTAPLQFEFGSVTPTEDGFYDLFLIHLMKLKAGLLSLHPARFISRKWFVDPVRLHSNPENFGFKVGTVIVSCSWGHTIPPLPRFDKRQREGFYFATRYLAESYAAQKLDPNDLEPAIKDRLAERLGAQLEVRTKAGRIDCLTEKEMIEVKAAKHWMHGFGQLLVYAHTYINGITERKKILYLFDYKERPSLLETIRSVCCDFSIDVQFELVERVR